MHIHIPQGCIVIVWEILLMHRRTLREQQLEWEGDECPPKHLQLISDEQKPQEPQEPFD